MKKSQWNDTTWLCFIGGSCDYGHKERAGGGAYILVRADKEVERYVISGFDTTEFRKMLEVMLHAMEATPQESDILFVTNVAYIHQNFDREPTDKSANSDLIRQCIEAKTRHRSVKVQLVSYHKYPQLSETHELAHDAMLEIRNRK